ncbi:hypothetical protein [Pseudoduganella sp.]|uniref:hypothetical protein n=1 Tax=Pseudoduganella sp. TaxID=1880898 RepID=UPI0035B07B1F
MTITEWTALLDEPKSILGPYNGTAPSLSAFAPHAWRAHFNQVAIAGQFLHMPNVVPASWGPREEARAEVVFEFYDVRLLRVDGTLERDDNDDSMHGMPKGKLGQCTLTAMSDAYIRFAETGVTRPWKQFSFSQPSFSLSIEAGGIRIYCGRRVSGQFGHGLPYVS